MTDLCFGFIGLGLIGGSIAKAIKKQIPNSKIIAFDTDTSALQTAFEENIISLTCNSITSEFSQCDYIFLCSPVSCNNEYLAIIKNIMKKNCILTDVGSVKNPIHKEIAALGLNECFIGGHPMTGSEHTGYSASSPVLLENAYYILTPCQEVPPSKISDFNKLIQTLGAIPLVLDSKKHDYMVAGISHLPHVIAFSLVNLIKQSDDSDGMMKRIAAGGFKDITRIASSSPVMWQQIFDLNQEDVIEFIDAFIEQLSLFKEKIKIQDSDYIYHFIESAGEYRDSFENAAFGPISRSYSVSIFIPDETGMIAEISTLFAKEQINIKNIGIIHNRESGDGSLKIEFYDKESLDNAIILLKNNNYDL